MGGVELSAGFVKFPRAECYKHWSLDPLCLALFVHLLARANREPKEWNGIRIERGQLVTSRRNLSQITGISEQSVRTALAKLTREGLTQYLTHGLAHAVRQGATSDLTHGYTIITICNFDNYEGYSRDANPRGNQRDKEEATHAATQKPTTTKEDIKNICADAPDILLDPLTDWAKYCEEQGRPLALPSQVAAAAKQIRQLSGDDPAKAVIVVREAISNGWKGLHRPNKAFAALEAAEAAPAAPASKYKPLNPEDLEY